MGKPPVPPKPKAPAAKVRAMVRRQLIVDSSFQFRMLIPTAIFAVILGALLAGLVFLPIQYDAQHDPSPFVRALLAGRVLSLHAHVWPAFAIAGVFSCLYALVYSNRLAGPLYKLRVVLIQLADGKVMRIRFREKDELREFEGVANKLAKQMTNITEGKALQLASIQKRLKFLKARLQSQPMETFEICNELDEVMKGAGLN
jgi:hypothetical protein